MTIAIHGGAGTILKSMLTPELETKYKLGLQNALDTGFEVLKQNGTSVDAVAEAVKSLEDNELFNAGKGAVFTNQGKHEMDASIMRGDTLEAGAVAGVQQIKNPILLAKDVMKHTEHVLLSGNGALEFAKSRNYEIMNDEYFYNQFRYDQWQEIKNTDSFQLDHAKIAEDKNEIGEKKFGTVGAVALDSFGNIAAATSTGGMTNKRFGRVGDTPVIGSGTYANNNTCAVSCTGHGEYFLRAVVAYDISCLIEYKGFTLQQACNEVVKNKLVKLGGEGGLIALDTKGNFELSYNSEGMYRGVRNSDGVNLVGIYK